MANERTGLLASMPDDETTKVGWDGRDDPANPLNWSKPRKWGHVATVSFLTFLVYVKFNSPIVLLRKHSWNFRNVGS